MSMELENAHKMIKVYQIQIKKIQEQGAGQVFDKIQTLERLEAEKNEEIKTIKKRLYNIGKSIDGNGRKLASYNPNGDEGEFKLTKLHEEASSLKFFVQEAEDKHKLTLERS